MLPFIRLKRIINMTHNKIFHKNKSFKTSIPILLKKIPGLLLYLSTTENLYLEKEKNII
jgi:hypothetical protein